MTAEIGEHERAPRAGESYLTPLRATLRDPPSKWAIKGFFPECRAAGFLLHTFLSPSKEKCERPIGLQAPSPAPQSARQAPPGAGQGYAPAGALGAFRSPPVPFGSPLEAIERPIGLQALLPRRSRRVNPRPRGIAYGKVVVYRCKQGGFPLAPLHPLRAALGEKTTG